MDGEDGDNENQNADLSNNDQEVYDILEEELDLHVPVIGENNNNSEEDGVGARLVPNGFHFEDDDDGSTTEEELLDEEVPLQPRIMLGGIMAFLGQHRVDDSSSNDGDDTDDNDENREEFDSELPGQHSYLGEGREVGGRTILDDDTNLSLPLLNQPGLALVPGQLLPLHLFHPAVISMMRKLIDSSKTFGVLSLRGDSSNWAGLVGTTAEIFEYQDGEQEAGLKLKARGRQRFKVVSTRRQVDGNLVGEVRMLVDRELPEPLSMLRLKSWDRLSVAGNIPDPLSPQDDTKTKSCFSFLSLLKSSGSSSARGGEQRVRGRRRPPSAVLSPLPPWVWDLYSPTCLVSRLRQELSKLSSLSANMSGVPSEPTELSWWVTSNLPLQDNLRTRMLALNSPVQRLRLALSFLSQCRVLVCRNCSKQLGEQANMFSMSKEGPQGAFVNPSGHLHETLTLFKAKNLRLVGRPSTEYSWFPGYAWTITECLGCWSHIGWKFTATQAKLAPQKFYGFSRKNIEAKVDFPEGSETEEECNQSDMIM